jgi:CTP synthase (UTP-ammonia lyase)
MRDARSNDELRELRPALTIGLVGDYDSSVLAHQAIPLAIENAAAELHVNVRLEWVATQEITSARRITKFDGLWCVPKSPYRSMQGALLAICFAREHGVPFLGTCGGFQHAVVEYARNVLGWADAEHAESVPGANRAVISLLECGVLETAERIHVVTGTRLAAAYGQCEIAEAYLCRYGLNREFQTALLGGALRVAASDAAGNVRAVELDSHSFFVATLFQPERAALASKPVPIVRAFIAACARRHPIAASIEHPPD